LKVCPASGRTVRRQSPATATQTFGADDEPITRTDPSRHWKADVIRPRYDDALAACAEQTASALRRVPSRATTTVRGKTITRGVFITFR
jgi:hypothetical protein